MKVKIAIVFLFCLLPLPNFGVEIFDNFIEVHNADSNKLRLIRLSPHDPAVNELPKVPAVPVIPGCLRHGYFKDPFNCAKFYWCDEANTIPSAFYCQRGLIFNTLTNVCDYSEFVDC